MTNLLIIIPAFNEEASLPYVFEELKDYPEWDLLIVDDASTDNTLKLCLEYKINTLPLRIQLGAWAATQTGIRYAAKHHYECVITMDGDGQHHPKDIPKLLETARLNPKADVIIGECIARGSQMRHIAWKYFRMLTGLKVKDITSGFRLYKPEAIQLLARKEATMLEYQDVGILLMFREAGLTIKETRVSTSERLHGKSHLFSTWLKVTYYMIVTTILAISKHNLGKRSSKESFWKITS